MKIDEVVSILLVVCLIVFGMATVIQDEKQNVRLDRIEKGIK